MKKLILFSAILLIAITSYGQRVHAYSETSSDTLKVETTYLLDSYTVKLENKQLVLRTTVIDSSFAVSADGNEFVSAKSTPARLKFAATDTLFKVRFTSDTTYIVQDTADVWNVYDRPVSNKVANLYKSYVRGYIRKPF